MRFIRPAEKENPRSRTAGTKSSLLFRVAYLQWFSNAWVTDIGFLKFFMDLDRWFSDNLDFWFFIGSDHFSNGTDQLRDWTFLIALTTQRCIVVNNRKSSAQGFPQMFVVTLRFAKRYLLRVWYVLDGILVDLLGCKIN